MKHVTDKLHRYLAGELSAAEAVDVEKHLKTCSACTAELRQERELWLRLGDLADRDLTTDGEPDLWAAVQARTTRAGRNRAGLSGGRPALVWSLAGAALAAGLGLGLLAPAGLLESPDGLVEPVDGQGFEAGVWLSDRSWLSESDDDLDLVWLQAGNFDAGNGS